MKLKKISLFIILSILALILSYCFIWVKYSLLISPVNKELVDDYFKENHPHPAVLDSIIYGNYSITYLTNNRNSYDDIYHFRNYQKQPYIFFIPEEGRTATDFLPYFLDKELSNKFHFIALNNITDIKNQGREDEIDYNYQPSNRNLVESFTKIIGNILKQEGKYFAEVRIITNGNLTPLGITSSFQSSQEYKGILLNATVSDRSKLSKWYSAFITSKSGKNFFPNLYVNKHRYLRMSDHAYQDIEIDLNNIAYNENKENDKPNSMFKGAAIGKALKLLFFVNLSNGDRKEVIKYTKSDKNFIYDDVHVDMYDPSSLMKYLYKCDDYSLDFNSLENRAKELLEYQEKNK